MGKSDIDMFASRTSHQLPKYVSWRPDPMSFATDALQQDWTYRFLYAFPPFCLVGQTLRKVERHHARMIIVAPLWVSQPWYPLLLDMAIANPILIPSRKKTLMNPGMETHPLMENGTLTLTAWLVSGKAQDRVEFRKQLCRSYPEQEPEELEKITQRPGTNSPAGVIDGKLIHFHVL